MRGATDAIKGTLTHDMHTNVSVAALNSFATPYMSSRRRCWNVAYNPVSNARIFLIFVVDIWTELSRDCACSAVRSRDVAGGGTAIKQLLAATPCIIHERLRSYIQTAAGDAWNLRCRFTVRWRRHLLSIPRPCIRLAALLADYIGRRRSFVAESIDR